MPYLSHEKLTVYKRTIQFVAWAADLIEKKKITGALLDQFKRAFISIALNIAEGAGKGTGKDQAKFYNIAKGSSLECGACLDVLVAMRGAESTDIERGKELLIEIVSMLTALAATTSPNRVREDDDSSYEV